MEQRPLLPSTLKLPLVAIPTTAVFPSAISCNAAIRSSNPANFFSASDSFPKMEAIVPVFLRVLFYSYIIILYLWRVNCQIKNYSFCSTVSFTKLVDISHLIYLFPFQTEIYKMSNPLPPKKKCVTTAFR